MVTLDEIRLQVFSALEVSRAGIKAIDPVARAFSEGRASGLSDALHIVDKALQEARAERIKSAQQSKQELPRAPPAMDRNKRSSRP